jgi:hypothetical protein
MITKLISIGEGNKFDKFDAMVLYSFASLKQEQHFYMFGFVQQILTTSNLTVDKISV